MRNLFNFTKYRPWNIKKNAYSQWKNSYIILVIVNKMISNHNYDHISYILQTLIYPKYLFSNFSTIFYFNINICQS